MRNQIVDTLKLKESLVNMWLNQEAAIIHVISKQLYNKIAKDYTQTFAVTRASYNNSSSVRNSNLKFDYHKFDWKTHCLIWKQIRMIWIGYYKNNKNNNCLIRFLPKDIVVQIMNIAGYQLS